MTSDSPKGGERRSVRLEHVSEFMQRGFESGLLESLGELVQVAISEAEEDAQEGGLSGNQLRDAIDLSSNDRYNPGGPTGEFRKTSGGIRGNPKNNDSFFSINFKIGYNFGRQSR